MSYLIICLVALAASALTLFSGFGLGTILLPAFGLFFPIEVAIALTAIVHFLNNLFKLYMLGKKADKSVIIKFGLPSIIAAFIGSFLLLRIEGMHSIFKYNLGIHQYEISMIKLIIGLLLIVFAFFELIPRLKNMQFDVKYLPLGGLLSGFFGGLSGHQGALRSAFLIRAGLSKEAFIATGVVIACMIDISRLSVYAQRIIIASSDLDWRLITLATLSAFLGAFLGNKWIKKVTISMVQNLVAVLLILFGTALCLGLV